MIGLVMLRKTLSKFLLGISIVAVAFVVIALNRQTPVDRHCAMLRSVGSNQNAVSYIHAWSQEKLGNELVRVNLGFAGRMKNENGLPLPLDIDRSKLGIDTKYLSAAFDQSDKSALANSRELRDYYSVTLTSGRATLRVVWDPESYEASTEKLHDRSKFEALAPNVYLSCE